MATSTASDKISKALDTLKNELREMRSQDVQLMKDLIHINSTLRKITQKPSNTNRKFVRRTPGNLRRKDSLDSCSSLDEISSSNDSINSTGRTLPRVAMSIPESDTGYSETQYHSILMTNIKVWKTSMSDESSSEIEDDS